MLDFPEKKIVEIKKQIEKLLSEGIDTQKAEKPAK
jgi:hypothetical protein